MRNQPFKGWEGGWGLWDRVSGDAGMAVFPAKQLGPNVWVQYLISVFCLVGIKGHYRTIFNCIHIIRRGCMPPAA